MGYKCKIVADSLSYNGCRLTTFEVTYPLIIHSEILTHRVFSRNVASNRAIPVKKLVESVQDNPFIPEKFPKNQAGMQSAEWLEGEEAALAKRAWLSARDNAVSSARAMMDANVHKQIANRLLAPFLWTTAVITATEWNNFFSLRCHPMAQPEIQKIAYMMRDAYQNSKPKFIPSGSWHLPYITEADYIWAKENAVDKFKDPMILLLYISMGRCARVSYLRQGTDTEQQKDVELCESLIKNRHMSPTEHAATPETVLDWYGVDSPDHIPTLAIDYEPKFYGNFRGWKQYRKFIDGESGETN